MHAFIDAPRLYSNKCNLRHHCVYLQSFFIVGKERASLCGAASGGAQLLQHTGRACELVSGSAAHQTAACARGRHSWLWACMNQHDALNMLMLLVL